MEQSITTLLGEIAGTTEVLEKTRTKEQGITQTKEVLKTGLERAQQELYDRIWNGESTGNVVDDIIIATKGSQNAEAYANFRRLMIEFAKYKGEFVAGRHKDHHAFGRPVLVGIISGDMPTFCWNPPQYEKPYVRLPISPAVSFDSEWDYGYLNVSQSSWKIYVDKDEIGRGKKCCYELEKLWDERNGDIHIGDEAVWKFIYNHSKNPFSPMVTFIHLASVLSRPAMTVPVLKRHVEPLIKGLEENMSELYGARRKLSEINKAVVRCPGIFSTPTMVHIEEARQEATANLKEAVRCVRYASHPHKIKEKK
jgi:hypothetical protein